MEGRPGGVEAGSRPQFGQARVQEFPVGQVAGEEFPQ